MQQQKTKVRWGIMGGARVNQRLLPAISEAVNAELVAVASRRPGGARETLEAWAPAARNIACHDRLEALLEDDSIDAIYLPMANEEHAEWALRTLESGKHVLCEKPMALKVSDIDAMAAAARNNHLKLMEGFMYRLHPQHDRVGDLIREGLIGSIQSTRGCFSFMMKPSREYRLARPMASGGGALWDIGCYAVHAARMWMPGQPQAVTAMAQLVATGADTACSGIMDYGDGRYAQFDFSFSRARRSEYEIIGSKGGIKCHTVWQNPGDVPVISWWTEEGESGTEQLLPADHFVLEIEQFSDCILHDTAPLLSIGDARTNCAVLEATIRSIRSGSSEKVISD